MIKSVRLQNFGPIGDLSVEHFGNINILVGPNQTGKTVLLKSLYAAMRTIELYQRGKNIDNFKEILFKKLYWLFQVDRIGEIVKRPIQGTLQFEMHEDDGGSFSFSFSPSAEKQVVKAENTCRARDTNSVFLPAKEVLSLLDAIKYDREVRQTFGFDDTYYDLANALTPAGKGKNIKVFSAMRSRLEDAIHGKLQYSKDKKKWEFIQGGNHFDISLTSEGTKKMAILDTLLGNHYLSKNSIVFIDEPEAGLHPSMVVKMLDIIASLAKSGLQFFIASHSYFVIKKLYLIAHKMDLSIPVVSFEGGGEISQGNLRDGMPKNSIITESINLYREEMML